MKRYFSIALMMLLTVACIEDVTVGTVEENQQETTPYVLRASFEQPDTKSRISMNGAGTYAQVLWTSGDAIQVREWLSGGGCYIYPFSTTQDGVTNADFTNPTFTPSAEAQYYTGYYPQSESRGNKKKIGVWIPSAQTAPAGGGLAEGLNKAYAYTTDLSGGLTFKNIPALVKFRLTGGNVGTLKSIKFVSNSIVAGDILMDDIDQAEPTFYSDYFFTPRKEDPSYSITLSGTSFSTGTDYYIAMLPGTTNGFLMTFSNSSGDYVVLESSKSLTLTRSRIVDMGTINIGDSYGDPAVTKYRTATKGDKPVDIVVLPDGFTSTQKGDYATEGSFLYLAKQGIDALFNSEPYKTYADYFNVYFIWKASNQAGASVSDGAGNITEYHDTAFGSFWGGDKYEDMAANTGKVYGFVSAHCPSIVKGTRTIDEVPVLLIINDARYGGRAHITSSGRTYCMVPYTYSGGAISWYFPDPVPDAETGTSSHARTAEELNAVKVSTGDWRNTLIHEFGGHSFGRLADEYWYTSYYNIEGDIDGHSYLVPFGLNVSGHHSTLPWQSLLDNRTTLMETSSLYGRIGIYQGADVSLFNRWRSEIVSCMIDNRAYFSAWQRVLIAQRILTLSGDITGFNMVTFLKSIDPKDALRDSGSGAPLPNTKAVGPIRIMPPLAPPELVDNCIAIQPAQPIL